MRMAPRRAPSQLTAPLRHAHPFQARSATPPDPHASRRIIRVAPPLSPRADNSDSGAIATYAASATRRRWRARRQRHVNRRSNIKRFRPRDLRKKLLRKKICTRSSVPRFFQIDSKL